MPAALITLVPLNRTHARLGTPACELTCAPGRPASAFAECGKGVPSSGWTRSCAGALALQMAPRPGFGPTHPLDRPSSLGSEQLPCPYVLTLSLFTFLKRSGASPARPPPRSLYDPCTSPGNQGRVTVILRTRNGRLRDVKRGACSRPGVRVSGLRGEALSTLPLSRSPDLEARQISEFPFWLWAAWAAER